MKRTEVDKVMIMSGKEAEENSGQPVISKRRQFSGTIIKKKHSSTRPDNIGK